MSQETNKRSVRAGRRSARSRTQAIFFDKSLLTENTFQGLLGESLVADQKREDLASAAEGLIDDGKRMFSFKDLLGKFSAVESQESWAPSRMPDSDLSDVQMKGIIMNKKRIFETLARDDSALAARAFCPAEKDGLDC